MSIDRNNVKFNRNAKFKVPAICIKDLLKNIPWISSTEKFLE